MVINNDRIEARINKLPEDLKKFTEEIFELAPDTIHQGAGTLKKLEEHIRTKKHFWLWWD